MASQSKSGLASSNPSGVKPEDVNCPPILIVIVNNNPKQIAITPGLTFQQVLAAIAKSKADEYEIVSTGWIRIICIFRFDLIAFAYRGTDAGW